MRVYGDVEFLRKYLLTWRALWCLIRPTEPALPLCKENLMARPASKGPTELELEILKILWQRGPLPVRDVRDALVGFRDLARTSVITIMNIMVRKKRPLWWCLWNGLCVLCDLCGSFC